MTPDRDEGPRSGVAMLADFSAIFARAALWGLVASLTASAFVLLAG